MADRENDSEFPPPPPIDALEDNLLPPMPPEDWLGQIAQAPTDADLPAWLPEMQLPDDPRIDADLPPMPEFSEEPSLEGPNLNSPSPEIQKAPTPGTPAETKAKKEPKVTEPTAEKQEPQPKPTAPGQVTPGKAAPGKAIPGKTGPGKVGNGTAPAKIPVSPAVPARVATISPSFTSVPSNPPLVYGLVAKIALPRPAFGFRIEHDLPPNVKLIETTPKATVVGEHLIWQMGRLDPGQEIRLQITVQPDEGSKLYSSDLTSFHATYQQNLYFQTPLVRPRLVVRLTGQKTLDLGDESSVTVEVANTGNWPVSDIQVRVTLPDCVSSSQKSLQFDLGAMLPTEIRKITLPIHAQSVGAGILKAEIVGSDNIRIASDHALEVRTAILHLKWGGPARWVLRQNTILRGELLNSGNTVARNNRVVLALPNEVDHIDSDGVYNPQLRQVTWDIDALTPNLERTFTVKVYPHTPGDVTFHSSANASHAGTETSLTASLDFDEAQRSSILDQFLHAMGEDSPQPRRVRNSLKSQEAASEREGQHIIFSLDSTDYAVPIGNVTEVGRPPSWTPLPNVPDWLLGVTNIRGDIVSLVNLRSFLGQENYPDNREARMLVVRSKGNETTTALVVDRVRGLRVISEDRIVQPTSPIEDRVAPYMRGVTEQDGRVLVFLDIDRLLLSPEIRQFEAD